jgi:type IV secretory pathway VirB10-like protein
MENKQPINEIIKIRKWAVVLVIGILLTLALLSLIKPNFKDKRIQYKPKTSPIVEYPDDRIEVIADLPKSYAEIKTKPEAKEIKTVPGLLQNDQQPLHDSVNKPLAIAERDEEKARKSGIMFSFNRANQNSPDQTNTIETQSESAVILTDRVVMPQSHSNIIMAGTVLPCVLITGINSDLPGIITAQIRRNIYGSVTGSDLLIPMGTKILGRCDSRVNWAQERVQVNWNRLIFPNGSSLLLGAGMPGTDEGGATGFKDQVNNHYGKLLPAILVSTFLSAGAEYGDAGKDPQIGETIAEGLSRDINHTGQRIVNRQLNIRPTIEIKQGFPFNIMVDKDIILDRYNPHG